MVSEPARVNSEPVTVWRPLARRAGFAPAQGCARKGMAKQGGTTKVARSRPCPVSEPAGRERFFMAAPKERKNHPHE